MASRETRRSGEKKGEQQEEKNIVEKRREKHPVLYAGSVILFLLIAVSFVGTGLLDTGGGFKKLTFGRYDGKPIEYTDGSYFATVQRYFGDQFVSSSADSSSMAAQTRQAWQLAFDEAVKQKALSAAATEGGYFVSSKAVGQGVLQNPMFRGEDGEFDIDRYRQMHKLTKDTMKKEETEAMLRQQYTQDALFAPLYSDNEIAFYKEAVSTERAFNFVEFSYSEYPDSKVKEYGENNAGDFRKIKLSRIVLAGSSKATAEQVKSMYENGERSFSDLAREYSSGVRKSSGGDMGVQYFYQVKDFFEGDGAEQKAADVFALEAEQVSAAIPNGESFVIYQCNEAASDADLESPETINAVRNYLLAQKKDEISEYILQQANTFKADAEGTGFTLAASGLGKVAKETEYFPMNYLGTMSTKTVTIKGEESAQLSGVSGNKEFFTTAFSLSEGEISEPIVLVENNKVILLQLLDEKTMTESEWDAFNQTYQNRVYGALTQISDTMDYPYSYVAVGYEGISGDFNRKAIDEAKFENNFDVVYNQSVDPSRGQ